MGSSKRSSSKVSKNEALRKQARTKNGRTDIDHQRLVAKIRRHLDEVRRLAPPPRYEIHDYLRATYALRQVLMSLPKSIRTTVLEECAVGVDAGQSEYLSRKLIDLTVGDHVKKNMREKYALTIACCAHNDISTEASVEFIKAEGGLNSCVKKQRPAQKSRRRGTKRRAPSRRIPKHRSSRR